MRRIAVFAMFAVLLAGCTSGGRSHGSFSPTVTYSPPSYSTAPASSTPARPATTGPNVRPGEKPPTLPAVGRTHTDAGARAFATFYVQALDWGYATTDSTLARSLFSKTCAGCARFVGSEFDQQAKANRHYSGGRLVVTGVISVATDHHDRANAVVDVTVSQAKGQLVDARGHTVRGIPALAGDVSRVWLRWMAPGWTVVDWKGVVQE